MTTTWCVWVEFAPPDRGEADIDGAIVSLLTEQLHQYDPKVVVERDGHVGVAVTLDAATRRAAFDRGDKAVTDALAFIGLASAEVVAVQVLTAEEVARRKRCPRVPAIAGVREAAALLNVSMGRIKVLAAQHPDELPMIQQLAGKTGPKLYLEASWKEFDKKPRVRTGRPPRSRR